MKKGIKVAIFGLLILTVIFSLVILITYLKSWNKAIIWVSIRLLIIGVLAILVLLLFGLDYEMVKNPKNKENKVEKKFDLTLIGILTKLLMSLILIVSIIIIIEMAYEHFVNQKHTAFFQRIIIYFVEQNTNYMSDCKSGLSDHIGYLQLLVAVVTIAIGGIALINFVTSREALKEVKEENKEGIKWVNQKVEDLKTEINQDASMDSKEKDGAELENLKKILSDEEDLNDT